jgi:hypothetical protein
MAEQVNNKQKHDLGSGAKVGNNGGDGGAISMHPGAMAANLAVQGAADDIAARIVAKADALPARTGGTTASKKSGDSGTADHGTSSSATPSAPVSTRTADTSGLMVGKVDGGKVFLTAGENAGIKVNDYYEVRRVTGTMKDANGGDIEMDEKIETVVVTDVQDKFAVAKPASGGGTLAKVGDKLKKTKAAPPAVKKAAPPAAPAAGPNGLPAPVQRKQ